MNISLRTLGFLGMIASPFFAFETYFYQQEMQDSSITGICDLIYMVGWSCSIIGLIKLKAAGNGWGKNILLIQLALLTIANIWNVWVIFDPLNKTILFNILDKFWPISNCFMFVTGVAVLLAKQINGLPRFVPLITGSWLPVSALTALLLDGNQTFLYIMTGYSFCCFFLLGLMIFKQEFAKTNVTMAEVRFN
jgi:hypothetical protein